MIINYYICIYNYIVIDHCDTDTTFLLGKNIKNFRIISVLRKRKPVPTDIRKKKEEVLLRSSYFSSCLCWTIDQADVFMRLIALICAVFPVVSHTALL